nr:MbcA/ParS/Xre antitoxin family protein [uncultured Sphingomonas sp.]
MSLTTAARPSVLPDEGVVLSRATAKAASIWSISNETLGQIIGVSGPTVSRLRNGKWVLERGSKPFELAQLFVRLFRSLDALMGGDDSAATAWLNSDNSDLGARPIDLITTIRGLFLVADYVDDFRGQA